MKISLIIPCYNEEESLPPLYEELKRVTGEMPDYEFEMIFVDDGSKDKTLSILKEYASLDDRITYISFSRNFGNNNFSAIPSTRITLSAKSISERVTSRNLAICFFASESELN